VCFLLGTNWTVSTATRSQYLAVKDSFTFHVYYETLIKFQFKKHMNELKAKEINLPSEYLCQ
jgi:hypothetical protein